MGADLRIRRIHVESLQMGLATLPAPSAILRGSLGAGAFRRVSPNMVDPGPNGESPRSSRHGGAPISPCRFHRCHLGCPPCWETSQLHKEDGGKGHRRFPRIATQGERHGPSGAQVWARRVIIRQTVDLALGGRRCLSSPSIGSLLESKPPYEVGSSREPPFEWLPQTQADNPHYVPPEPMSR